MLSQAQRDTARKAGYDDGVNARARVAQSTKALTAIYDKAHAEGAAQLTRQRTEYEALMDAATDISGAVEERGYAHVRTRTRRTKLTALREHKIDGLPVLFDCVRGHKRERGAADTLYQVPALDLEAVR